MWKSFLLATVFIFSWICINCCTVADNKEELIQNAMLEEMHLHPEARLVDIYKFFFQGAFGPGHIIRNKQSALKYLQNELQSMTDFDSVLWQPVGFNKQYYRISLGLVQEGRLLEEELFNAFVQSADSSALPSIEEWIKEWNFVLNIIEAMNLKIINYEEDKSILDDMLEEGNILVHHSNIYRKLYHPHYRIVDNKQFEKLGLHLQKGL
ncbi:MAG: hypothetical protein DRQ13_08065 [Ignavibacteriae bacterium]|nr:MAG: hypothetical protein DRQ13_08065 [Ignavibacteriota bacterium]